MIGITKKNKFNFNRQEPKHCTESFLQFKNTKLSNLHI